MKMIRHIFDEIKRIFPLILIMVVAYFGFNRDSSQFQVQFYKLSMVAMVIALLNIVRQILFPYIQFGLLYNIARRQPLSAAIVLAAFIALLIAMIVVTVV